MTLRLPPTPWAARLLAVLLPVLLGGCGGERSDDPAASQVAESETRPTATSVAGSVPTPGDGGRVAVPPTPVVLDALFAPGGPTPLLTPCGTDGVLVVEGPDAAAELERRVRLERPGAEGPVRVTVRGGVGDESGTEVFRLEEVVAVHRADDCPEAPANRPLEKTAWQLSGLSEADPAVRAAGAWLRLDGETGRIEGSTGCRALVGRYDWNVTRLRFAGLESAAPGCAEASVHRAFLGALARTGSYRIDGGTLVLLGEEGPVATLRAPEP